MVGHSLPLKTDTRGIGLPDPVRMRTRNAETAYVYYPHLTVEEPSPGSLSGTSGPSPKFTESEIEALAETRCLSAALACLAVWMCRRTSLLCIQFTLQLQ